MFENTSVRSNNPAANKTMFTIRENFSSSFEQNEVSVCGTVESVSQYTETLFEKETVSMVLLVPRLSGNVDRVPVCIPVSLIHAFKLSLNLGDALMVNGQVRTRYDDSGHSVMQVFATFAANTFAVLPNKNAVRLTGEIAKQPVYRVTPFGREITDTVLRVPYSDGSYRGAAYVPIMFWGKTAKIMDTYRVNETISVCGRFQSREYDKLQPDGNVVQKTTFEVSVHHFTPIERNLLNNRGLF